MDKGIAMDYETIGVVEQRNLIEVSRDLGKALTPEEYNTIMYIYKKVIDRLVAEAEKQGIEI